MRRQERIGRLDRIWTEYLAAESANDLLDLRLQDDPSFGSDRGWRRRDALRLRANLEVTFLIRMFAEFESGLRDAWEKGLRQKTQPPMRDLMVAISARLNIPASWHGAADEVRADRNASLHEGTRGGPVVPLADARSRLIRYLSRLPLEW